MTCDLHLDKHTTQMYIFLNIANFSHVIHKDEYVKNH